MNCLQRDPGSLNMLMSFLYPFCCYKVLQIALSVRKKQRNLQRKQPHKLPIRSLKGFIMNYIMNRKRIKF